MLKIGQRIKYFREKKGVTQGYLAEKLNMSAQAVSKWETGSSYPDITLIPMLAEFFNVSCDALLADSVKTKEQILCELLTEADKQDINTRNGYFSRLSVLEDALMRYPCCYGLMLELSYLYSAGTEYPEFELLGWKKKIIDYCECVYAKSDILCEKYGAMTLLCYTYSGNNNDRVIEIATEMPEIYQSKPALIYHGYEGNQKFEGMYTYFIELLDTSYSMIGCLVGNNNEIDGMYDRIKDLASNRKLWITHI